MFQNDSLFRRKYTATVWRHVLHVSCCTDLAVSTFQPALGPAWVRSRESCQSSCLLEKGLNAQPSVSPQCPHIAQQALFLSPARPETAVCKERLHEELQSVSPEVRGGKRLVQSWTSGSLISRALVPPVLGYWFPFETCLELSGEGIAWCWRPATYSSQNSPVSLPLSPQFFCHSSLPSKTAWPSRSFLYAELLKMPWTVLKMQHAHYLQPSHEAGVTLHGKLGLRCQKLPGHWELIWLSQDAAFVCETILTCSKCQTMGMNSAHRKTDWA